METVAKKIGRPKRRKLKPLPANAVTEIERLAGIGMTKMQIHYYYGMTKDEWVEVETKHPEYVQAFTQGKAQKSSVVMSKLWEHIEKGNLSAIQFYLKTQCRWREIDRPGDALADPSERPLLPSGVFTVVTDASEAARIYEQIMKES